MWLLLHVPRASQILVIVAPVERGTVGGRHLDAGFDGHRAGGDPLEVVVAVHVPDASVKVTDLPGSALAVSLGGRAGDDGQRNRADVKLRRIPRVESHPARWPESPMCHHSYGPGVAVSRTLPQ